MLKKISYKASLFADYTKITLKSCFQYKMNVVMLSLAVFLREATTIIVIYLTLQTFTDINGWKMNELLFLFSLIFLTYGILIIFFTGLRDFEEKIVSGTFDRFILRPHGILIQIISSGSDWFAALGHGTLGVTLFLISAGKIGVVWNINTIVYYILTVFGGVLIQASIFLLFAALSFYFVRSGQARDLLYWNVRKFAGYPISIFPKIIQAIMIFIMPFAFVNYFPAQYLLNKPDMVAYPQFLIYMAPFVGVVMIVAVYVFWRYSLRHYKSTGS